MNAKPLNRRNAYTGQTVTATLKDGSKITGTLRGWGYQEIRITAADKTHMLHPVQVASVYAA